MAFGAMRINFEARAVRRDVAWGQAPLDKCGTPKGAPERLLGLNRGLRVKVKVLELIGTSGHGI